ncbi:MAG: histidinol dehydrogenase [Methanobacteriota archaeon]
MKLRFEGVVGSLSPDDRRALLSRTRGVPEEAEAAVRPILADVRARGDEAVREWSLRFDGVEPGAFRVPDRDLQRARDAIPRPLRVALEEAARRIRAFHKAQLPKPLHVRARGSSLSRLVVPLTRIGAYVPGGRATYPSTALMTVVPAKVAGVPEVVACTPPGKGGAIPDVTLAALAVADADEVYAVGGAQAVAAMAYGTPSIPRVDKIVGPGGTYVNAAKRLVFGEVGIDTLAGPSELLIVGDGTADPRIVAAELVAQAEHDPEAKSVLVSASAREAARVRDALEDAVREAVRRDVVAESLARHGGILTAPNLRAALALARAYAPEHLLVLTRKPRQALGDAPVAGSIFLGPHASVALGDYGIGPNHVLPTAGAARFSSGLSVDDFLRRPTVTEVAAAGYAKLAEGPATIARAEGLVGHAAALVARSEVGA